MKKKCVLSLKFPHASSVKILIKNFLFGVPAFVRLRQHDNISIEKFVFSLDYLVLSLQRKSHRDILLRTTTSNGSA